MAQQFLNTDDVHSIFQQMGGITVAKHMHIYFFDDACIMGYALYCPLHPALAVTPIKAFAFRIAFAFKQKLYRVLAGYIFLNASY